MELCISDFFLHHLHQPRHHPLDLPTLHLIEMVVDVIQECISQVFRGMIVEKAIILLGMHFLQFLLHLSKLFRQAERRAKLALAIPRRESSHRRQLLLTRLSQILFSLCHCCLYYKNRQRAMSLLEVVP